VPAEPTDTTKIDLAISQIDDRIVEVTAENLPTVRDGDQEYELGEYLDILVKNRKELMRLRDAIAGGSQRSMVWLGTEYP
jgi:hypothetical protein